MQFKYHMLICFCGCIGLLLGSVLVDLDHFQKMSFKEVWECAIYNRCPQDESGRGFLHKKHIMLSLIAASGCLCLGLITHYCADFV